MEQKIEFDKEMVEEGQWSEKQKEVMQKLMTEINNVMKERFPGVADCITLDYQLPNEGIGVKFKALLEFNEEHYLGELQNRHLFKAFKEIPERSENTLKAAFNDQAVVTYYQVLEKAITSVLSYVIKRSEDEGIQDTSRFFVRRKKVIPMPFIPEDIVLMHPKTLQNLAHKK